MSTRKTVTVKGITWAILSANERCTTVEGRHFYAGRCGSKGPWYLCEHDCNITTSETGAHELGYSQFRLQTNELSLAVLDITSRDMVLPKRTLGDGIPLVKLVSEPTMEYLKQIGVVEAYAARPADLMKPIHVQVLGRGLRPAPRQD